MRIGNGGGRRTKFTPNNSGMSQRAEQVLNKVASSYSSKLEHSLAVDGVPIYIWNQHKGHCTCLCQRTDEYGDSFTAEEVTYNNGPKGTKVKKKSGYSLVEDGYDSEVEDSSYFDDGTKELTPKQKKLKDLEEAKDILKHKTLNRDTKPFGDVLDAFESANNILDAAVVSCPICLGSSYADAWKLEGCQRILLEFSGISDVEINDAERLDEDFPKFRLPLNSKSKGVIWKTLFPVMWKKLLRLEVYNEHKPVNQTDYVLDYKLENDTVYNPLTKETLKSLNGNTSISDGDIEIRLRAKNKDLEFTHVDIILQYDDLTKAQFPDLDIVYEDEYVDSNINVGIEISSKAKLKEGSYIYDTKHNRVWKIDSFTKKTTVSKISLGYIANCRALHSFERMFLLFKMS